MNIATVTVPEAEARQKVAEYMKAVRERHTTEDELILRGYQEILKGHKIINLPEVLRKGGLHADGTPRLAVVRADAERCFLWWYHTGTIRFAPTRSAANTGSPKSSAPTTVKDVCAPFFYGTPKYESRREFETIAPIVPPRLRPARGIGLYHVIFEVEEWKPVPPVDPALVRHISGDLWAVIAMWDLTPLERLAIAGR